MDPTDDDLARAAEAEAAAAEARAEAARARAEELRRKLQIAVTPAAVVGAGATGPRRFVLSLRFGVGRPFGAVALVGAVDSGPGADPASGAPSASSSLRRPSSFTPVRLLRPCSRLVCGGRSRALPCWNDQFAGCRAGVDRPGLLR